MRRGTSRTYIVTPGPLRDNMPRIDPESLETFVAELAASLGAPANVAGDLAASLVAADLRGHSSHGVRLLPAKYVPEIGEDKIDPAAEPRIVRDDGVFVTVDGRRALGQVAARETVDAGVAKADEFGVGVASLRNVSHVGRVGEWAERATTAGMALVGFVSNPGSRWVAPPGSAKRRLSTNPVVVGLPTFDALRFPLVLDVATGQVARSKIRERATAGEALPDGWVVGEAGSTVTDADAFEGGDGAILPLGGLATGHKGFGLATMAELLAGNASDGSVSGMDDVLWGNHALFLVVDVERWTTRDALEARLRAFVDYVRDTEYSESVPTPGHARGDRALVPGEAEHRVRERRREEGIPVPEADAATLRELAVERDRRDAIPSAFR